MIDAAYCRVLAGYNRWMNEKLYALCAGLSDAERRRDRGAFFGSIHATLNHLMLGDLALLSRLTGDPPEVPPLGEELYADFDELAAARRALDARIERWADGVDAEGLATPLVYTSVVDGRTREIERWVLAVHLFNHQIHHRGQLTTLLSQLGLDLGSTDLPFAPGVARQLD